MSMWCRISTPSRIRASRTLSHECYVSTTTMIRFVRKLGFSGYSDFINLLRLTDFSPPRRRPPSGIPATST